MNRKLWTLSMLVGIAALIVAVDADTAHAINSGGGGLPYEAGLTKIVNSVKGPVAQAISVIGIVIGAGALLLGGDMQGFFRVLMLIVLVVGILVKAVGFSQAMFGSGATIASATRPVQVDLEIRPAAAMSGDGA